MNLKALAVCAVALSLVSCASVETVSYKDVAEQYEGLKKDYPQRVIVDFEVDCVDKDTVCKRDLWIISGKNLDILQQIITKFNDEIEHRIDAHNNMASAITHCEYANAKLKESIGYQDNQITKLEITSTAKQIVSVLMCGALLYFK